MPEASGASRVACALALLASFAVLAATVPRRGIAHIVYGRPTLMALVGGAELVAHVEVLDAHHVITLAPDAGHTHAPTANHDASHEHGGAHHTHAEDGSPVSRSPEQRPAIRVQVREVLKGDAKPGDELVFASHGHGVAEYTNGDEALVFLVPSERSRELAVLAGAGLRWVSFQEHDARFVIEGSAGRHALEAARRYAAAGAVPEPEARLAALRAATVAALLSGDARVAEAAVQDVALTSPLELVTAQDVPRLVDQVVTNEAAPMGVRLALLGELGRRGLVDATPIWLAMLRQTKPPALTQVARAAGAHRSLEIEARLVEMLGGPDAASEAAALALGHPHHSGAVPALAEVLDSDAPRVRMAAIRSLGHIATPEALRALEAAASANGDEATRRRAAAEVRRLERAP